MSDSLTAQVIAGINGALVATLTDANTCSAPFDERVSVSYTDGTTASKSDKVWYSGSRTLTGTTNEDLDVYDFTGLNLGPGAAEDPLGQSIALAEITAIMVYNKTTSTGNLTLGGEGSTDAWAAPFGGSNTATMGPYGPGGGCLHWRIDDPAWAVADGDHKLRVASSGNLTYDIYILGRSA